MLRDADWLPVEQERKTFLDCYLLGVRACLRGGVQEWWQHAFAYDRTSDAAANLDALRDFCLRQLVSGAGDIAAFEEIYRVLDRAGIVDNDDWLRFLLDLTRFVREEQGRHRSGWSAGGVLERAYNAVKRTAVVSIVLLDAASLANFFEFCIYSLASERNLKALRRSRRVQLHVFAREAELPEIRRHLEALKLGCLIVCEAIPERLALRADDSAGPQGAWLVGALQWLHLQRARHLRADFHAINPHALYADGYFEAITRLRRQGKSSVLVTALYARPGEVRDALRSLRGDMATTIPAVDLATLAVRVGATGSGRKAVVDYGWLGGPSSHLQIAWQRSDCVEIHSTQHEIAFLSHRALARLSDRFCMNVSAELDKLLSADMPPHFVSDADRVALLDLSQRKNLKEGADLDLAEFTQSIARSFREPQIARFRQPIRFAIDRRTLPVPQGQSEDAFSTERLAVLRGLEAAKGVARPRPDQAMTALGVLQQLEMSEYGPPILHTIISEGRRLLDSVRSDGVVEPPLRRELIRAAMNFDHFAHALRLAEEGGDATAFIRDFLIEMARLRKENEAEAKRLRPTFGNKRVSVVGAIAWGERFVDKFMNYCLASLLSEGNILALSRDGGVVLSIVTTAADRERMMAHPHYERLRKSAEVVFTCFPAEFLKRREADGLNFYHFYGLLDHQSVFLAQAMRADLYLLPIDSVYSNDCLKTFSSHLRNGADCCSIGALEVDEEALRAWLDAEGRRKSGVLDLPGAELVQVAAANPDRYFRAMVVSGDGPEFCAHPRELVWALPDGLAMHSVFMHPLAVSSRLLIRPFHPHHENVDYALLPRLMQDDGRMKVIGEGSEATLAHFGAPDTRAAFEVGPFSVKNFMAAHRYDYAVHRQFFDHRQFFRCRETGYRPSVSYESDVATIQSGLHRARYAAEANDS